MNTSTPTSTPTTIYRVQISRGGVTHGMRHGGMTLCGKSYVTALDWNVAETITCKRCQATSNKAPKAKAAKTSKPKTAVDVAAVAQAFRAATTHQEARDALTGLTVALLGTVWTKAGRTDRIPSKLTKAQRIEFMVENTIGNMIDFAAILNSRNA